MKGSGGWNFVLCLAVVVVASWAVRAGAETEASEGVLVLRNGNVLEGAVRQAEAYYRVDTSSASLQVPAEQVEMFCASLDEAYESRRRARAGSSADSHLELARWCLRLNLLKHAARELEDARTMDPRHPGLAGVQLQLNQLRELEADRGASTASPAPVKPPPITPAPPFDVSADARAKFVRSVQPMLIHTCATGGCHQPASGQRLQLDRWALAGNGNATLVRRNLAAVLNEVVKSDPAASPLLVCAGERHGVRDSAASRPLDTRQMTILREWLNEACGVKPAETAPEEGDAAATMPSAEALTNTPAPAGLAPFVPRDAFDAEIFNRRHARPASAATAPNQPATQ